MSTTAPSAAAGRSRGGWYRPLLTLHIVSSVSLAGAAAVLAVLGVSGVRGADPRSVYPPAYLVEAWLVAPLAVVALGSGVVLALLTGRGLLRYWWVATKLGITTVLSGVVLLVLLPLLARSAAAALAGEQFTTAQRLPLAVAPTMAVGLLILNAVLGVYRPGRRRG